jgi:hypothetical protein
LVVLSGHQVQAEKITASGPLVDLYCWDDRGGIALDTKANLKENPFAHTVHCLVEVSICKNSGFAIVHKPENATRYEILYKLDALGNQRAKELMLQVPAGSERYKQTGFQISITGTVDPADPTVLIMAEDDEIDNIGNDDDSGSAGLTSLLSLQLIAVLTLVCSQVLK